MCGDSWWEGGLSDKGQCKGLFHASTDSKPNVHVQDDSLKWKFLIIDINLKLNCVDVCL